MLGELIYESTGKIIGQRVVDAGENDGPLAKVEVSYSGTGYMQGVGNVRDLDICKYPSTQEHYSRYRRRGN